MTNAEKYKTSSEREKVFYAYCKELKCGQPDHLCTIPTWRCALRWLDLEVEKEKILPCPFCGNDCTTKIDSEEEWRVFCNTPGCYRSTSYVSEDKVIADHNRVARAALASRKEGDNDAE